MYNTENVRKNKYPKPKLGCMVTMLQTSCKLSQTMQDHAKQLMQSLSRYDHMFGTPCAVHSLNLAFKTIIVEVAQMKKIF
jgi:hypothetical protein